MAKGRKKRAMWQGFLAGGALSLGVYLLGLLLLTLLLVKGTVSEGGSFPLVAVLCGLSALAGGVLTVRLTGWRAGGALTAAAFLSVLILLGLGFWEQIAWLGRGGVLLLCAGWRGGCWPEQPAPRSGGGRGRDGVLVGSHKIAALRGYPAPAASHPGRRTGEGRGRQIWDIRGAAPPKCGRRSSWRGPSANTVR